MYIRAKWESIKGAPFSRAISLPHRWRDRCHEERKTLFRRGGGGGEGSCFCSSTIEEPHLPYNRQIIRVKRWSSRATEPRLSFNGETVLNGWLSATRWNEGIVVFDTRCCCFCLIFERLCEREKRLSSSFDKFLYIIYIIGLSEKERKNSLHSLTISRLSKKISRRWNFFSIFRERGISFLFRYPLIKKILSREIWEGAKDFKRHLLWKKKILHLSQSLQKYP